MKIMSSSQFLSLFQMIQQKSWENDGKVEVILTKKKGGAPP